MAMTPRELMEVVRSFCAANYPGCRLEYITIHCRRLPKPIRLVASPPSSSNPAPVVEDEKAHVGMSPVIQDVLAVLREAKRPMSRTLVLEALAKSGKLWSERAVAGCLAQLVQDGTLENVTEGRHRGYRVPPPDEQ